MLCGHAPVENTAKWMLTHGGPNRLAGSDWAAAAGLHLLYLGALPRQWCT